MQYNSTLTKGLACATDRRGKQNSESSFRHNPDISF